MSTKIWILVCSTICRIARKCFWEMSISRPAVPTDVKFQERHHCSHRYTARVEWRSSVSRIYFKYIYLYLCATVNISGYSASKYWIIFKKVERRVWCTIWGTKLVHTCRLWGKPWNIAVRVVYSIVSLLSCLPERQLSRDDAVSAGSMCYKAALFRSRIKDTPCSAQ